jgi:hypothetical protein
MEDIGIKRQTGGFTEDTAPMRYVTIEAIRTLVSVARSLFSALRES